MVLCFGILRPYKGIDVLIEAFRELEGAELWVVGRPWMDCRAAQEGRRTRHEGTVRFVDRFVPDSQIPAFFRRADVVALPYRRIDQSGVLYTALAFGKAMVLSDVGGFSEVGRVDGAAELVPPEDPSRCARRSRGCWPTRCARKRWRTRAADAAAGRYSWDAHRPPYAERLRGPGRRRGAAAAPPEGIRMRAILMGKHKRSAVGALEHLVGRGVEVVAVVAPPDAGGADDSQRLDLAADSPRDRADHRRRPVRADRGAGGSPMSTWCSPSCSGSGSGRR